MSNGAKLLLPDARFRSPTAVEGKADMRDENIYSSLVIAHGGAGQQKVFTVPQGQAIPRLVGAGIAPTAAHQLTHSELTTNLTKAGEAGSALGDFSVRGIGITFETGYYDGSGVLNGNYGMGQQEVNETLSKTFFQLKIAGKKQIEGATFMFPASGAAYGGISTSEATVTVASMNNGWPGALRRLKLPVLVARTDTIEGIFGVAASSSLVFSVTTGIGQSSLVWFNLYSLVKGDVR
jgi:hypothetical protein